MTEDFSGLTPLAGGWSGQTFLAEAAGERSVVRIYPPERRGDPEVDAAVLALVRGILPVAEVLEVRRGVDGTPGLLVTSFMPGVRGDELLPTLSAADVATVGQRLGTLVADLAGMPQPRAGWFADADLAVRPFTELGMPEDLRDYSASLGLDLPGLLPVLEGAQELLETVDRCCLVHSDLNPKNVLVDPASLEVTALLDWEYAHAGNPFTDLGNLLRFDRDPVFADAVLGVYTECHGGTPGDALARAEAADLWALLDLASRAGDNPVADRALAKLHELAT